MAIKYFTKQYAGMLPDLFAKKSAFLRAFGGVLQVKDGVTENDTFMELKVSDTDVVIQAYSTDANVGFGSGTGNTSRFGQRKEVKSVNKQVSYDAPLAINEGIDDFTVNDIKDQVVAERLALHRFSAHQKAADEKRRHQAPDWQGRAKRLHLGARQFALEKRLGEMRHCSGQGQGRA